MNNTIKRLLLSIWLLLLSLLSAVAENYPYKSDMLWVTVPSRAGWLYKTGERATVEVQFYKYGIPRDNVTITYEIGGDMIPVAGAKRNMTLKDGRGVIPMGAVKEPGFHDCRLRATVDGKTYSHHIKVGSSPEKLHPCTTMLSNFREFWEKTKAEQKEFFLTYTKEHVEKYSADKMDCYLVKLQLNKRGQCVYEYLFYPEEGGKFPVALCLPGAGIKAIKESLRHKHYAEQGCIRFGFKIHGLNLEMNEEELKKISNAFDGRENGYPTNGLDNRDNYYMKRVCLAYVRSIDFLTSLPGWDGKNIIAQGDSRGGVLVLIAVGLDERVTACVANHSTLSDMAGYRAGHAGGYPHFFRNLVDMDTPGKIKTMAYYDIVNFAKLIKADTYMTWGFNDDVCPSTTSYIVYNVLNYPEEILITPINEHWTSNDTEYGHLLWIKKHLK